MKSNRHFNKLIKASVALFLSFCISSVAVYAWFSGIRHFERQLSFRAEEGVMPDMDAWVFDIDNDTTDNVIDEDSGESIQKNGSWRSVLTATGTTPSFSIDSVIEGNATGTEQYKFTSLHLGTIDNLISLSNDNYFLIRFDVSDVVYQGRKVRVAYSVTEDDVELYDVDGNRHTTTVSPAGMDFDLFSTLVNVECAVSTTLYDPENDPDDADAIIALMTDSNTAGYAMLENGDAPVDLFDTDKTGAYYVYVCFSPKLEECMEATETINIYMPCELIYNMTFEIEFYQVHK